MNIGFSELLITILILAFLLVAFVIVILSAVFVMRRIWDLEVCLQNLKAQRKIHLKVTNRLLTYSLVCLTIPWSRPT